MPRFCKKNAATPRARSVCPAAKPGYWRENACSSAPAGQEAAPAAGLALRRTDLLVEFVRNGLVIDAGVIGWPHNGNDGWYAGRAGLGHVLSLAKQRRGRRDFGLGWRRRRRRRLGRFDSPRFCRSNTWQIILRRRLHIHRWIARCLDAARFGNELVEFGGVDCGALVRWQCRERRLPLKCIEPAGYRRHRPPA